MLRPERMSRVSVAGAKSVMDDVVETAHDLNLLHVTDYDGAWEGFSPGDPMPGAEEASEKLITVRSVESMLDVDEEDGGPVRIVTDEALEEDLPPIREKANELDDRRDELRDELRSVDDRIESTEPFVDLGIDLDLLSGYRTLQVAVGEGRRDPVDRAVRDADTLGEYGIFPRDRESGVLAVFARPTDDADDTALTDALVSAEFTTYEIPDAEGSPENYVRELEDRKREIRSELNEVEDDLRELRMDAAGFLLSAEERLSIDVQKTEAPLSFATTENAFVAEGWIPSERYREFEQAIEDAVGGHVQIEELERADFDRHGESHHERAPGNAAGATGDVDEQTEDDDGSDAAERGREEPPQARTDGGGTVTMRGDDEPPVVQDNPGVVKPFEVLVNAVNRPNYWEYDPSVILLLTFPAFFGFMIGDLGYGVLYTLIGAYLYTQFDRPAFKSMGGITLWAGGFTMLFGILYGEIFGLHLISTYVWGGHPPIEKGLSPAGKGYALGWLTLSILVGVLHLNVGYVLDFIENWQLHDVKHAVFESGSWILMLNGLWVWVFSHALAGNKPAFIYTVFDGTGAPPEAQGEFVHAAFNLGFNGFPATVGWAFLGLFALGLVLLLAGEPVEAIEFLNVLVNALSYTRLAAVLLAKAGMAFTVNLLFFGAYQHDGEFHFLLNETPHHVVEEYGQAAIMFPGLMHSGAAGLIGGLLVLLLGHALVLALGVTSAGLQAIRLEYVEFFGKFYEGGGDAYEPFGYDRQYSTED